MKLWVHLRGLRQLGHHFRRQSPIPPYIVDFECRRAKLIVEVDGGQHGFDRHLKRDMMRDRDLHRAGYRVLRFWNNEADEQIEGVLETILAALSELSRPTRLGPSKGRPEPPSPRGEG
ncbi:MAG TPA: endonuclease domain-containing protein [Methyloceanibacter sp.]|nr:endonuclease domain-containing protein [Methyloceanibacter sp.]